MRDRDVPQDGNRTLGGHRKVVYAKSGDGRLHPTASSGWEAEEVVTLQAVDYFEQRAEDARRRAEAGECSPLEVHMYRKRMDYELLAQAAGLWQWRVRRHCRKPAVFARLGRHLIQRYADALNIEPEQLHSPNP